MTGEYKDGIVSKDEMVITGGKMEIVAKDDGLVARDMLAVKDGHITIQAAGDGIKTTNDTDGAKGFVALEGGTFSIHAGADGIQAETSVQISGGTYKIVTNGGSTNSNKTVSAAPAGPNGMGAQKGTPTAADSGSAKGIKAAVDISISGGTFDLDTADDAIHSNGSITIAGGQIAIASGDDGIHADAKLTIRGGKTTIAKSYEGIESKLITIAGGETRLTSLDDGVNVGGGNDGSSMNGRPGQNTFASAGDSGLFVDGGYVAVSATGDGVDVNGSIRMTDGTIVVSGPTASNNGALDYDGTFEMTGGFVIAAGSAGMAQAPSEQSTQHAVAMVFSSTQQAGTLVSLHDQQGNAVVTYTPSKPYQSVVISSPKLKKGETYTLYTGGTASGTVSDGLYTDGARRDGTKVVSFAITNVVTWLSESGVTTGGPAFGGPKRR
ncbi:MAG: dockerin type 1 [Symbiobacteriaceae bacterium]|nr:dockerin type 1 [Symbiobacteriaceae bacterium]